jgi:methyl-accepting chemotaxis protein
VGFATSLGQASVVDVLSQVQALTIRSAEGSASTAVRLDSVRSQTRQANESLEQILHTAEQLHHQFGQVSITSKESVDAAIEMLSLSTGGRELSDTAMGAAAQLQIQMQATVERMEKLVGGVAAIIRVSETIEDIARNTTLLSFNATIEAARAGEQGRGFAVVAGEVRSLAQSTEACTSEIKHILDELAADLTPARDALRISRELVTRTAEGVRSAGQSLERIAEIAVETDRDMKAVAEVVDQLNENIQITFDDLKSATASWQTIARDAKAIVTANFAVSQMVEECFVQYAKVDLNSQFHRNLSKARELARLAAQIFEGAIDDGRCTLEDVLAYDYREIKGAGIQSLSRLFDVSRVPPEGFNPPKFSTRYDAAVDVELQQLIDRVKASDASLVFSSIADLNLYMPIHHSECCLDWTGDPKQDTANNRLKRIFTDKWTTPEGVRIGLGPNCRNVPNRATREEFINAGCEMRELPGSAELFCVKLAVRDATTVMFVIHAPLFVRGHRYGAVLCGWTPGQESAGTALEDLSAQGR